MLVLATLAAGQSVAARAEIAAPRAVAVRMVGALEQRAEQQRPANLLFTAPALAAPRPAALLVQRADARASDTPLYLLNRALLR